LVHRIREEAASNGGGVIFLHAGDVNTGYPESDMQHALCDLSMLRKMGCDAMVLGNHEFDNPLPLLDFQNCYARFPFLSANYVDKYGNTPFESFIIKRMGDITVAVVGLTTESTAISEPTWLEGGGFLGVIETAREIVPRLAESADVVIALGHLGWKLGDPDATGSGELAASGIEGLDIIIDGHSHTLFNNAENINGVLVAQAGAYTTHLGRFDLEIEDGEIQKWQWSAIPLVASDGEDGFLETELAWFKSEGDRKMSDVIGESDVLLDGDRAHVRFRETNLAKLVTDAMKEIAAADLSVVNAGGIRDSIQPGKITMRDIYAVLPFRNDLVTIDLSGGDILEFLETVPSFRPGSGGFPHFSGVAACFKDGKPCDIKIDGAPLNMDKIYRLATSSYLANGADGYEIMKKWKDRIRETGFTDTDSLATYIERNSPVSPQDDLPRLQGR
ncbi:MAG: 5'-nucleotidase C-terminal domain-containing protein, partial [Synergistota bacterium]|nr:5'-nucleotidase C-terminal domain-containing protein [Synergistota bacterium]